MAPSFFLAITCSTSGTPQPGAALLNLGTSVLRVTCQIAACIVSARQAIARDQSKLLGYLIWVSLINSNVSILTNALDWLDATIAAFFGICHGSIGSQCEPEHFGTVDVDLRLELPSEQNLVPNSQIHRVRLPRLRKDFRFFLEASDLDDVLDAILSTDVPLCMAPKSGLYNLSSYEVCSRPAD